MPHYREVQPETGGCGYVLVANIGLWLLFGGIVYGYGIWRGWW